jgi:hypothetical protein
MVEEFEEKHKHVDKLLTGILAMYSMFISAIWGGTLWNHPTAEVHFASYYKPLIISLAIIFTITGVFCLYLSNIRLLDSSSSSFKAPYIVCCMFFAMILIHSPILVVKSEFLIYFIPLSFVVIMGLIALSLRKEIILK